MVVGGVLCGVWEVTALYWRRAGLELREEAEHGWAWVIG